MSGCGMHSRPNLAEKARYNSLLKKVNNSNNDTNTKKVPNKRGVLISRGVAKFLKMK